MADRDHGERNRRVTRTCKRSGARSRRTDRDLWIVEALARMRFLSTRQIALLFFGASRSAANKRLRHLLDAGVVRVWLRNLNVDNVYSITPLGRRLLIASLADRESITSAHSPRELDRQLDHLLAVNDVHASLAVALPEMDGTITWWRSDWELRTPGSNGIVPDALFCNSVVGSRRMRLRSRG